MEPCEICGTELRSNTMPMGARPFEADGQCHTTVRCLRNVKASGRRPPARESLSDNSFLFVVFLLTGVISTIANGWMLSVYWDWFVLPLFPTMPHLTVGRAVGMAYIVTFLFRRGTSEYKKFSDITVNLIAHTIVYYPLALLLGYVLHSIIQ